MHSPAASILAVESDLAAPAWATSLLAGAPARQDERDGVTLTAASTPRVAFITARVVDAIALNAAEFERRTVAAYAAIQRTLAGLPASEPVRFWNHLPGIHQAMDAGRDRYMVFNAGRFAALCDWFGGSDRLADRVATASGVGHRGRDLVVHCLAGAERGVAVENPRQIPAFRYSKRYGPLPPCFARATVVRNLLPTGPAVLVGGTASICGERSMHQDALAGQIRETLANLGSLVTAAGVSGDPLAAFTHVRLYHPRPQDAGAIESAAAEFTSADRVQLIQADLCRSELLVEIEGVARLESF
jgi:chorismate lyase/3-hydroxybenzoate synthase